MVVHNPSVELDESAGPGGRALLGAPLRSGIRRVVPGHIRVSGDPLDGPSDGPYAFKPRQNGRGVIDPTPPSILYVKRLSSF